MKSGRVAPLRRLGVLRWRQSEHGYLHARRRVHGPTDPVSLRPTAAQTQLGTIDGPGAILPNGNILVGAGPLSNPGNFNPPVSYFEFDGAVFNPTSAPPNNNCATYLTRLLLLPNGDVFFAREDDSSFYAYHSDAAVPQDSFRPVIQTCPASFAPGTRSKFPARSSTDYRKPRDTATIRRRRPTIRLCV